MENNGRGIFYGVIGVATLVVAVIGATFAFFSASIASGNEDITAQSQNVAGTLTLDPVTNLKDGMVPVKSTDPLFKNFIGTDASKCVDLNGNDICSVYQFKITNTAKVAQTIGVNLVPVSNTFVHLNYAIYAGSDFTAAPLKTAQLTKDSKTPIELVNSKILYGVGDTATGHEVKDVTYTLVLWIEETEGDQTSDDAAKAFAGGINIGSGTYDSSTGAYAGGITGVLSAS